MKGKVRGLGFYLIVLIILIGTISVLMSQNTDDKVNYSDVVRYFEDEQVRSFEINNGTLYGVLRDGTTIQYDIPSMQLFLFDLGDLIKEQRSAGIIETQNYTQQTTPWWISMLPSLVLLVIIALFWYFMLTKADGGAGKAMSFGKSRAKLVSDENKKVTFADVAGADEEKGELQEIVEFLKNPRKFVDIGARIPKGVLLVGPPGTGKTLIARAVAGEAGVPFFTISGSDFVELYVGVGASRVRDLFEQAKKHAPAIIFIDEIDAVGRHRGAGLGGGHDEREQTLNQLLVEMDGFGANEGVIIISATNRPDILDPALLRPGRFDRQVYVGLPDIKGRESVLRVHARNKPFDEEVDFSSVSRSTVGFTGADLENLLNEAALLAARHGKKKIGNAELDNAFLKVIMGNEKRSKVISEKERRLTAYHEAGHALATRLLPSQDPVHQISIIPRGRAGGFTLSPPTEDKSYMAKSEMLDELVVFLGGRVAEQLVLNDISTGASNDIQRASDLARQMVTKYGMSDSLGPVSFSSGHDEVFLGRDFGTTKNYSEEIAAMIDREIKGLIANAYTQCEKLLAGNMEMLHKVAAYLLTHETMAGDIFEKMFTGEYVEEAPDVVEIPTEDAASAEETTNAALTETSLETESAPDIPGDSEDT